MEQVFLKSPGEDDDVIEINEASFVGQTAKNAFHTPLKISRPIDETLVGTVLFLSGRELVSLRWRFALRGF